MRFSKSVKRLTREQVEGRKEKAVRFVRDVLGHADRAEEIEDEPVEDYAERRQIEIVENPSQRRLIKMATKKDLEDRVAELEQENEDLQSQLDDIADIVAPEDEDRGDEFDDDDQD